MVDYRENVWMYILYFFLDFVFIVCGVDFYDGYFWKCVLFIFVYINS